MYYRESGKILRTVDGIVAFAVGRNVNIYILIILPRNVKGYLAIRTIKETCIYAYILYTVKLFIKLSLTIFAFEIYWL